MDPRRRLALYLGVAGLTVAALDIAGGVTCQFGADVGHLLGVFMVLSLGLLQVVPAAGLVKRQAGWAWLTASTLILVMGAWWVPEILRQWLL